MGAEQEQLDIPYGRPISLRIHPALLVRLDHEVDRLNQTRPPRQVTRSGLIQHALRLLLDGATERTRPEAQTMAAPNAAEAPRHWQASDTPLVLQHKVRESRRRELWRRFEQTCDKDQITPPDWLRLAAQHEPGFDKNMLMAWYRLGELPEGGQGDGLMDLVEKWLESS